MRRFVAEFRAIENPELISRPLEKHSGECDWTRDLRSDCSRNGRSPGIHLVAIGVPVTSHQPAGIFPKAP